MLSILKYLHFDQSPNGICQNMKKGRVFLSYNAIIFEKTYRNKFLQCSWITQFLLLFALSPTLTTKTCITSLNFRTVQLWQYWIWSPRPSNCNMTDSQLGLPLIACVVGEQIVPERSNLNMTDIQLGLPLISCVVGEQIVPERSNLNMTDTYSQSWLTVTTFVVGEQIIPERSNLNTCMQIRVVTVVQISTIYHVCCRRADNIREIKLQYGRNIKPKSFTIYHVCCRRADNIRVIKLQYSRNIKPNSFTIYHVCCRRTDNARKVLVLTCRVH